jgi:DNA helicase-2/ATP-dependent DNA helicase PcrA
MRERVALSSAAGHAMWVTHVPLGCVRILRREAAPARCASSFSIYDATDSRRLLTLVCRDLELDPSATRRGRSPPQVSNLKNELVDRRGVRRPCGRTIREAAGQVVRGVPAAAAAANALDFDDLISETVAVLQRSPIVPSTTAGGSGTCSSTSTRTPTTRSTCWCASWSAEPGRTTTASPRRAVRRR